MPKVTINVPEGARIRIKNGPGVLAALAAEVASASLEAKKERSERRFARIVWPDNFAVGDLAEKIPTHQSCGRTHHAIVTHVQDPCWNQQIHLSYDEVTPTKPGWGVEASTYRPATCRARRSCECQMCKGWNLLGFRERWKRRHEAVCLED